MEVVRERKKYCFERYFSNEVERRRANEEYATFSAYLEDFSSSDSINDRWYTRPINGGCFMKLPHQCFNL